GKVYEGSVLEEDDNYIYLDTASGVINIRRADIAKRNGEPYSSPVSAAAPVQSRPAQTAKPGYLGNYLSAEDRDLANLPKPLGNNPVYFSGTGQPADGSSSIVSEAGDGHVIHSSGVTEKDLVDYHSAHPEEFRMPVQ